MEHDSRNWGTLGCCNFHKSLHLQSSSHESINSSRNEVLELNFFGRESSHE